MDTEKNSPDQPKGKTIFMEYSTWKKGQHFITVLQTLPEHQKKVVIARISMIRDTEGKVLYSAMRPDGKTVITQNHDRVALKKHLAEFGPTYASQELERLSVGKDEAKSKEQAPVVQKQQPPVAKGQTTSMPEEKSPADELKEIRDRGGKSKDKSQDITR